MTRATSTSADEVLDVLRGVDDPEYPGISIVDLGLVADIRVTAGRAEVDLIPTFSGCPALDLIATDVRDALRDAGHADSAVRFVAEPAWTPAQISPAGRAALADRYTVTVDIGPDAPRCPRCGSRTVVETSMFGPTRCRSIARCDTCGEHLEMIR